MRCKLLTAAVVALGILVTGCSTLQKVVYRPDINQGNFLTPADVSKLQKGMTKQQVAYILGTPMLQDPFGSDTWFYVFRQQPGHQDVTQQTLTLTFDGGGSLSGITNDTSMMKQEN
ncbi:outer membrane protein assembly factor BamE [Limnobaculum zhutongyuii]|uniref:Outer membrane protein assembly factor BamE n=1 Tax=Limnobaculum zhutongyuii TaxID=2498113 RepID=A0A411WLL3_9GAMM|nr:outer membrane protein assembly factor BamE [Limnobaculum zhutongyuii]QBH97131.1 outer membrane protein assembly factor BamE [Limnobaculum zhutongyuii]TQS88390.1 outer membrane protein assembly factor BamE [Limnobaculum zhutongyuii]